MFAYCGNNPVVCIDESGTDFIWQRLFEDGHFGFIHLAVQMHIILYHPELSKEQYVYNSKDKICGRADIVNLDTGEVWEIKTVKTGAQVAAKQVGDYCAEGNFLEGCPYKLIEGEMKIGQTSFSLSCMGDYYEVTYYSPQNGVILYSAEKTKPQSNPYAVYVPTPQKTKDRQSTIGGLPAYGVARAGVIGFGALAYAFCLSARGGGRGCNLACSDR